MVAKKKKQRLKKKLDENQNILKTLSVHDEHFHENKNAFDHALSTLDK